MSIFITGAAGFIGYQTCKALLKRGRSVVGIDNLNNYYDVRLKKARLSQLKKYNNFTFIHVDISDNDLLSRKLPNLDDVSSVLHLAAQAGVRYSLVNPKAYVEANIVGQINILELCRQMKNLKHLVYASSSSVYGNSTQVPFSEKHSVDKPVSLYAATKKADELMGYSYAHLFGIPMTGLRFFTVYGPWGRPDMAAFIFAKAIYEGTPIKIFNNGDMRRDFTYVDDEVRGVLSVLASPPVADGRNPPHRIYNIGNNRSEPLLRFVELLERAIGRSAHKELVPMQAGDVRETCADIEAIYADHGFKPKTSIDEGIPRFVKWFQKYHGF